MLPELQRSPALMMFESRTDFGATRIPRRLLTDLLRDMALYQSYSWVIVWED